jgi:hypothetical protein
MPKKNLYARLLTVDDVEIDYDDPALWRKGFVKGMAKIMERYEERLHQREAAAKIAKNMLKPLEKKKNSWRLSKTD